MHQKLPVLSRIAKFTSSYQNTCSMCSREEEDLNHLFFQCSWSKDFWKILHTWWPSSISYLSHQDFLHSLQRLRGAKTWKQITYAILMAGIYHIWATRNLKKYKNKQLPAHTVFNQLKNQIIQRVLLLGKHNHRYWQYIDSMLR